MSYKKTFTISIPFDGEDVVFTLRRLKRKDVIKLMPYINMGEDGEVNMSLEDQIRMVDVAAGFVGEYIESVSPISPEDLLEEAYYLPLLGQVIGELVSHSFPRAEEGKKSDALSENTSAG